MKEDMKQTKFSLINEIKHDDELMNSLFLEAYINKNNKFDYKYDYTKTRGMLKNKVCSEMYLAEIYEIESDGATLVFAVEKDIEDKILLLADQIKNRNKNLGGDNE